MAMAMALAVAMAMGKQQRAFNASDCGKRSFIAMAARWNHAREFIFDIGGKRHE